MQFMDCRQLMEEIPMNETVKAYVKEKVFPDMDKMISVAAVIMMIVAFACAGLTEVHAEKLVKTGIIGAMDEEVATLKEALRLHYPVYDYALKEHESNGIKILFNKYISDRGREGLYSF